MLQSIKPKHARAARALAKREALVHENPKTALFCRYTTCSQIAQLVMKDLCALKRPLCIRFNQKNSIHPFEDPSSLEFFSEKNDASLIVFGSSSKKRPHAITFVRCFQHKILDMLELLVEPESMRTLSQFKNAKKPMAGLKPLVCFAGTPFESPIATPYTLAKSLLLDFFKGPDLPSVDVEGLQYIISISAEDEPASQQQHGSGAGRGGADGQAEAHSSPLIRLRTYLIKTKKSGQKLPKVEVEEMGPRIDFRVGRLRQAEDSVMKEALKKPATTEAKKKKNVETDLIGDKVGRVHIGKQDFANLQTRKMKGLKRSRDQLAAAEPGNPLLLGTTTTTAEAEPQPSGEFKKLKLQD